jgi:hypothetical protein
MVTRYRARGAVGQHPFVGVLLGRDDRRALMPGRLRDILAKEITMDTADTSISDRDAYIMAEALATAILVLEGLPAELKPLNDIAEMRAMLAKRPDLANVALSDAGRRFRKAREIKMDDLMRRAELKLADPQVSEERKRLLRKSLGDANEFLGLTKAMTVN